MFIISFRLVCVNLQILTICKCADIIIFRGKGMSFSGYCNQVRKSEKLSQVKMSSILGISLSQYRNLEKERSILPRFEVFQRLADYLNKDVSEVVYDVFFFDLPSRSGDRQQMLNRIYLVNRFINEFLFQSDICLTDDNGKTIRSDGVFWKANFNYNRVMLANCSRELFLSAIAGKDKDTELKKAVFTDSLIADAVPDGDKIMEIRFVLDQRNSNDCRIYDELENIHLNNLGKRTDISYVLFDPEAKPSGSRTKLHYITNRNSNLQL